MRMFRCQIASMPQTHIKQHLEMTVCMTPGCQGQTLHGSSDTPSLPDLASVVGVRLLEE